MQTVTVPAKTIEKILSRLDYLTQKVEDINIKLSGQEPSYGSDEWWKWSDAKAMQEVKEGKYTKIHNKKELRQYLNSLKTA